MARRTSLVSRKQPKRPAQPNCPEKIKRLVALPDPLSGTKQKGATHASRASSLETRFSLFTLTSPGPSGDQRPHRRCCARVLQSESESAASGPEGAPLRHLEGIQLRKVRDGPHEVAAYECHYQRGAPDPRSRNIVRQQAKLPIAGTRAP